MTTNGGPPRSPAAPPAPRGVDMSAFDGLRGVASLMVALGHIYTFWTPDSPDAPWPAVGLNYLGPVTLFFVLSGYALAVTYDPTGGRSSAGPAPLSAAPQRRAFLARRLARLAPLYYFSHALALPLVAAYSDALQLWLGVPAALLGLQSATLLVGNQWNSAMWQVSALGFCYALFPRVLAALRGRTDRQLWAAAGWAWAASAGVAALQGCGAIPSALLLGTHMFVLPRIPHFVLGVATGLLAARGARLPLPPAALADAAAAVLAADLAACGLLTEAARPDFSAYFTYAVVSEYALAGVFAALLMGLAASGPAGAGGGWAKWALSAPPLRAAGQLSYALYATHWPVLFLCGWGARAGWAPLATLAGGALPKATMGGEFGLGVWQAFPSSAAPALLAVCVAAAAAAHVLVERPAGRWLRGGAGAGEGGGAPKAA